MVCATRALGLYFVSTRDPTEPDSAVDTGGSFVHACSRRQIQRSNEGLREHKYRFVKYLERTEGKEIFKGRG
jgi:hypothetical protein